MIRVLIIFVADNNGKIRNKPHGKALSLGNSLFSYRLKVRLEIVGVFVTAEKTEFITAIYVYSLYLSYFKKSKNDIIVSIPINLRAEPKKQGKTNL